MLEKNQGLVYCFSHILEKYKFAIHISTHGNWQNSKIIFFKTIPTSSEKVEFLPQTQVV